MLFRQDGCHLAMRDSAIADGATDEAVALIGRLHAVILEVDVADVARDPQVAARNMIVSIADPVLGELKVPGCPIKLSGVPERGEHRPPPALDADREAVLALLDKGEPGALAPGGGRPPSGG